MSVIKGLKGRDFLSVNDFTVEEIYEFFNVARRLKEEQKRGEKHEILKGKTLGMIFEKSSTRTRVSFEVAMWQLGGLGLFLNTNDLQIGRGEPIKDTARVLSRYLDGIMIRTFSHIEVEELAEYASIPVINGLTDLLHPGQVMADIFTVMEHKGDVKGLKLCYIGDGNNVVNSLLHICAKVGMDISVATPPEFGPDCHIVREAREAAELSGSKIEIVENPLQAAEGADVLYTDVWASMGKEEEQMMRRQIFKGYSIDKHTLGVAKKDAIILHCLPAKRGEEITDEAMECSQSVVFDEAENRLHMHKAILALTMVD
ncbi:ornithine carbamoyltransferase [Selenomonadales bacterium OttesenSCG-928-I06]|nr:ornithine carbamoyltransferase [Selenomonadales bacterium OttesenSCG-928-I06]